MKASTPLTKHKFKPSQLWTLFGLLVLPTIGLLHLFWLKFEVPKFALGFIVVCLIFSIAAYIQLLRDKKKAQNEQYRISELSLHILELLGGWPGSFLAQKRFRHKTIKLSYQAIFWSIVALYQILSIEYIFYGPISSFVVRSLGELLS